ncbi:MAG: PH domain-containing protein [Prevotellaceae bacterium]|jgi:signal transduction histidine kinase|nr:PH domain-containing protein [Prevotellaceae bacterium]
MKEFFCSWDKTAIIITILAVILVLATAIFMIVKYTKRYKMHGKNQGFVILSLIIAYLLPCVLIVIFLYMPTKICVNNEKLVVNQIKGNITIPLNEILEIRELQKDEMSNGFRTFGSGGLFGYLGYFGNSQLGKYQIYARSRKNSFLVKTTENKNFVFSCEKRDKLIQIVNNQINKQ